MADHYRWLFTMALSALVGAAAVATLGIVAEDWPEGVVWAFMILAAFLAVLSIWLFVLGFKQRKRALMAERQAEERAAIEEQNRPWVPVIEHLREGQRIAASLASRDDGSHMSETRDRVLIWQVDVLHDLNSIDHQWAGRFDADTEISPGAGRLREYVLARVADLRDILEDAIGWIL